MPNDAPTDQPATTVIVVPVSVGKFERRGGSWSFTATLTRGMMFITDGKTAELLDEIVRLREVTEWYEKRGKWYQSELAKLKLLSPNGGAA